MITIIALAAFLMEKSLTWEWEWIKTPLDLPILCLLLLCLLSTAYSMNRRISLSSILLLFNYLTIFYLTIHTFNTRRRLRGLIYLIIGIAVFLSIFGLFKKFGMNPFPWWDYGDIRYHPLALSSTYGNQNHLAGYMEMVLPLVLGLLLFGYNTGKLFILAYFSLLILVALILSLSRGGWIGILLGLSFMAVMLLSSSYFKRKKLLISAIVGAVFLALIVLASTPVVEEFRTLAEKDQTPSIYGRTKIWGGVLDMIEDYPVIGSGPGTFSTIFTRYQPPGMSARFFMAHNDYLQFVSETGLILIPIIMWVIVALYRNGFKKLRNPSRLVQGTTLGAMTGITAMLVHSIVDFNLHIPANTILFTVLAAIVVAPRPESDES
ncbi:O-antigen ligase family protein [Thermodesulfobacteriota bacterium]